MLPLDESVLQHTVLPHQEEFGDIFTVYRRMFCPERSFPAPGHTSVLQKSVLALEVSVLQHPVLQLDVSVLQQPLLLLDVSVISQTDL
jgi:hypothetical protein